MRVQARIAPVLIWLLIGGKGAGISMHAQSPTLSLTGEVKGASGKHSVYVALWDAAGFLEKPVQQVKIGAGADQAFHFEVPPGSWALSAYEDVNENGKLDMGMFGPKEPSGFWKPFHGWHKPRFAEVASTVNADTAKADIDLRR